MQNVKPVAKSEVSAPIVIAGTDTNEKLNKLEDMISQFIQKVDTEFSKIN